MLAITRAVVEPDAPDDRIVSGSARVKPLADGGVSSAAWNAASIGPEWSSRKWPVRAVKALVQTGGSALPRVRSALYASSGRSAEIANWTARLRISSDEPPRT